VSFPSLSPSSPPLLPPGARLPGARPLAHGSLARGLPVARPRRRGPCARPPGPSSARPLGPLVRGRPGPCPRPRGSGGATPRPWCARPLSPCARPSLPRCTRLLVCGLAYDSVVPRCGPYARPSAARVASTRLARPRPPPPFTQHVPARVYTHAR
jgi:hypothetical protein